MAEERLGPPGLQTTADYEAATDRCLARMRHLREQMEQDQAELDRLKAETRAILEQLKAA